MSALFLLRWYISVTEQRTCAISNVRLILDTKLNIMNIPLATNAWLIQASGVTT
jgi:hypothetical protein